MAELTAPLFVAGHPALDFLNTAFAPDGQHMEAIGSGPAFLDWLVGAELLTRAQAAAVLSHASAKSLESAATSARRFREQVRGWLERWRLAPERNYRTEIAALNDVVHAGAWRRRLAGGADRLRVDEQLDLTGADALLPLVAWQIALLVAREEASLVKRCDGPGCTLWFLDQTKGHRRRFCSATACGNRAKVAAFRERQRQ